MHGLMTAVFESVYYIPNSNISGR